MDQMDKAEEALALLEKEEKAFRGHWVWRELNCTPEELFKRVKQYVKSLNVPADKWNTIYQRAKEAHRIQALEKRTQFRPANLRLIGAIRV